MTIVPVTSADLDASEVSWFAALCSDDYAYLGVPDGALRSSWAHCAQIVQRAEANGFRNILCPSSYQVGQDTLSFVAGCAPITDKINLLAAVRCGEMQPIMLARTIATPSTPVPQTAGKRAASMPPMATKGERVAKRARRRPSRPQAGAVFVLVGVSNTGLTAK